MQSERAISKIIVNNIEELIKEEKYGEFLENGILFKIRSGEHPGYLYINVIGDAPVGVGLSAGFLEEVDDRCSFKLNGLCLVPDNNTCCTKEPMEILIKSTCSYDDSVELPDIKKDRYLYLYRDEFSGGLYDAQTTKEALIEIYEIDKICGELMCGNISQVKVFMSRRIIDEPIEVTEEEGWEPSYIENLKYNGYIIIVCSRNGWRIDDEEFNFVKGIVYDNSGDYKVLTVTQDELDI